jgi:hypothetical protein
MKVSCASGSRRVISVTVGMVMVALLGFLALVTAGRAEIHRWSQR